MPLQITFDTTFFMSHYFSNDQNILQKTREILRRSALQGSRGVVPTMVLAEFYAQTAKKAGAAEAERRLDEILSYGLEITDLTTPISKRAGIFRHKYEEKIPWGDCIIAATGFESNSNYIVTEDPEFKSFREIKCKKIQDINL